MKNLKLFTEVKAYESGQLKGFADVTMYVGDQELMTIKGLRIIKKDGTK